MYKKFNTYILENYPLLWHSRSIQLTLVALLSSLVAFLSAYMLVDLETLQSSVTEYYLTSNFVFFHAIFTVVILALWAAYFYKNNAIKSFYPLSRFYLQKLMLLLFVPFLLLISAYVPFTLGAQAKVLHLLNEKELKKDLEKINLAAAFLPIDEEQYLLSNRVYPAPFPLESLQLDASGSWDKTLFYSDSARKNDVVSESSMREYIPVDSNSTWVDGIAYQFYKTYSVYTSADSCATQDLVSKFYVFDSLDDRIASNSILNYSQLIVDEEPFLEREIPTRKHFRYNSYYVSYGEIYTKKYAATVHELVVGKKWTEIEHILVDFESVLNKYKVRSVLSPQLIAAYLKEKNGENILQLINPYIDSYSNEEYKSSLIRLDHFSSNLNKESFAEDLEYSTLFSFDNSALSNLYSNYLSAKNNFWMRDVWLGFMFFALFLVWLILLFEFIPPLSFLLSVPVGGVLLILVGLSIAIYSMTARNYGNDVFAMSALLTLILTIQTVNLLAIKRVRFNRAIGNILMSLAYVSIPFLLPLFIALLNELTKYTVDLPCDTTDYVSYFDTNLLQPSSIFTIGFASIFIFLFLVRKWKAKAE